MRRSGVGSGGGIGMNKHVDVRAPKTEPKSYARNPAAVGQYGEAQGNHVTSTVNTDYRGDTDTMRRGYQNPVGPSSMALSGPGAGRKVIGCGSQGTHGDVAGSRQPAARGILNNE